MFMMEITGMIGSELIQQIGESERIGLLLAFSRIYDNSIFYYHRPPFPCW
jgi:hypothetical protein